ncbi:class I SAM-dependent methyltransferase [Rhodobacteraceae bacterium RKSG542]|uniref:SAM-dependent methyltransferase n=1 Tax=Pseudovibrio flavus TaxID=2529854 RepID=UPI0012BC1202|nr:cyclopropane-fatty-acyl-phospholipid synthase family protein [Pseudovibrio flavus]MTI18378.1 class I SAM-dependent methyltransferase [Pseudovibrio flavus]
MRVFKKMLEGYVKKGRLVIIDADGEHHVIEGQEEGPEATIRFHSKTLPYTLMIDPELKGAEAYMDGLLTIEPPYRLVDMISVFQANDGPISQSRFHQVLLSLREGYSRQDQKLNLRKNKAQVRHHYDLSTELYRLFLDEGLNYSCAYYRTPEDTLEEAQQAKLDHIVAKLDLKPGMRVLEIGGGWGSLAIRMAQEGVDVVSLNVSREQVKIAEERAAAAGLQDRIDFVIKDYNEFEGQFDRVVSVGMMEHVGIGNYEAYFGKVRDCLTEDGFAMIHCIGRNTPPGTTGPFLLKYIFPGGYAPAMSEVFKATENLRLWVCDAEILRLHYYYTLRDWRRNFERNREQIKEIYDERFCRMWEFYLAACEAGFQSGSTMVFQLLIAKKRDAVPITRDFITQNEQEMLSRSHPTLRQAKG